jgi:hypothetical protein
MHACRALVGFVGSSSRIDFSNAVFCSFPNRLAPVDVDGICFGKCHHEAVIKSKILSFNFRTQILRLPISIDPLFDAPRRTTPGSEGFLVSRHEPLTALSNRGSCRPL